MEYIRLVLKLYFGGFSLINIPYTFDLLAYDSTCQLHLVVSELWLPMFFTLCEIPAEAEETVV
jgi:hypothetical protein